MRTGFEMAGRRLAGGFAAVMILATLGLTGCNQDNTPTEYGTLTQQNFLELCTNHYYDNTDDTLAQTDRTIAADVNAPTSEQCQCQYDVFVAQMPINKTAAAEPQYANYDGPNFTDLNAKLKENPQEAWDTVPASITDALSACMNAPVSVDAPSTTVAATEPTTTVAP